MLADIEAGKVGTVIVKDMSRIGRDYLQVGFYTEVMFREKGVHFIAISNGVDSERRESAEFAPFLNIMNEWYVRDTSRKITTVLKARGMSGKAHTTNRCCYGYKKSAENPNKWVIDEEAAEVVRRIFNMCLNGKGPYQIARELAEDKVERPEYYLGIRGRGVNIKSFDMEHPYMWRGGTVKTILTRMEYTGCTVNFRTKKESYKDKRPTKVDSSEWIIFEDTQEPIIDKHTWETVQKLLDTPRRKGVFEENNPLTGKVFCADCGAKMYHHRNAQGIWKKNYFKAGEMIYHAPEDRYDCSNNIRGRQRYEKLCCSHSITTKALETLVLETIKRTCDYAVENEAEFAAFATPYKKHIQYNINSSYGGILIAYSIEYRKELSNMKKSIITPLAAVLCLSLLTGCNAKDSSTPPDSQQTNPPAQATVASANISDTSEAYEKLVALKTEDYKQQSVADFNQSLAPNNGDISGLLDAQADVLASISPDDKNYEFITVTLAASLDELYCEQMNDSVGLSAYLKKEEQPLEKLPGEESVAGAEITYQFVFNALYRLNYTFSDPTQITVAERDSALQKFKTEFQNYVDNLSEADLTSSNIKTVLSEKADELENSLSTAKMKLSCEVENVEVHNAGEEVVNN